MRRLDDCFLSSTKSLTASAPTDQISQPSRKSRESQGLAGKFCLEPSLWASLKPRRARRQRYWQDGCSMCWRTSPAADRSARCGNITRRSCRQTRVSFIHVNEARMNAAFGTISERRWSSNVARALRRGRPTHPPFTAPIANGFNHQRREGQCYTKKRGMSVRLHRGTRR
jgi:hypothetical protein